MKQIYYWQLCLAIWLGIASLGCAQNKATFKLADDEKLIEFTTDKFTLPNLHVTSDGKSIIFDVLGDIYQVPIKGGNAEVLLQDNNWKRAGKLSSDGKTLAYVSDETGEFQVWTIDLETKVKRVYPIKESIHIPLYAYWKDNYHLLIPSKEGLQSFDITTGKGQIIRSALEDEKSVIHVINKAMSVNNTGRYAFFQKNMDLWAYDLKENIDLFAKPILDKAFLESIKGSANGEKVLFYRKNAEDNSKQDLISWDLTTNILEVLNTTQTLGISTSLNYSFDFIDDRTIVLDKEGQVVLMDIEKREYNPIPIEVMLKKVIKKPLRRNPQYIKDSIITVSVLRNPITRKDLDTIYFGALGKLHSYAKATGMITEIYPDKNRFEVSPTLSPDKKHLAYTTWNDIEMGHVYVRELNTGKEHQLTQIAGRYINPAWSPDGTELVFVADETEAKMGIPRQSGGMNTHNYHLDIHKLKVFKNKNIREYSRTDTISRVYPLSILPRRFYPIPVYHPNGERIFISTRNHEKDLPVLLEIDLKSKEVLQERLIPFHTDEVIISPDTEHIAFIFDEQVWVETFPHTIKLEFSGNSEFISEKHHHKGGYVDNILLPKSKSVYEIAPSYLSWQDENILMWGSSEEIYTYDVRTVKTEKIADIKVQKPRAVPKTQYALTKVRIITMNKQDEIIEKGTILIKDNRIEAVGRLDDIVIPKNYKIFDLEGKTIMPGLIDVHAHYHALFPFEILSQENYAYKGNLAYGVTTIYDPSVNVLDYREQAQMVEIGNLRGPRVFASGNIIMNGTMQYDYKEIKNMVDAERLLRSNGKLKVYGPVKEYGIQNKNIRSLLHKASEKENFNITSHQSKYLFALNRVINGYSAIEHEIGTFPLQKDIIQLIGQSGIHYTPTYVVRPGIKDIYVDKTSADREKLLHINGGLLFHNSYAVSYEFQNEEHQFIIDGWIEEGVREHGRALRTLKSIVDSNGKITIGGHGNPLPGIGTHWELWFMTKGMTNYKALQAATINGAEKLDLQEEIGSIETNKLADLLILNGNPLDCIFNTIEIEMTVINGSVFSYSI